MKSENKNLRNLRIEIMNKIKNIRINEKIYLLIIYLKRKAKIGDLQNITLKDKKLLIRLKQKKIKITANFTLANML